jgi:antagonist of KipI
MSEIKASRHPLFEVKKAGMLTTIQDLGRIGFQKYGVPVTGAMDPFALQVANILVGNPKDEGCMEITVMGPELIVLSNFTAALTGADLSPKLNGEPIAMWKSFELKKGDRLEFGTPKLGMRAYLSVAGGFDVPVIMGSKSTYTKAGIGKIISKGDKLYGYAVDGTAGVGLFHTEIPSYQKEVELRVISGPHTDRFTEEGLNTFFNEVHSVSAKSDRMGYRLESPAITHKNGADIWSDAIPLGGVQVPASGNPIILMADRQTTGGYTRIATVISVDIPIAAQLIPGAKIRFKKIDVDQAQHLLYEKECFLRRMEHFVRN